MRKTLLVLLAFALVGTAAGVSVASSVASNDAKVRDTRPRSCTTDAQGYCTVRHSLGVKPGLVLVSPRIPRGYKSYLLSVVHGSEDTDSFQVRAVSHDGKPRANGSIWFYADLAGTTGDPDPAPSPAPSPTPSPAPSPTPAPDPAGKCTDPVETWSTREGGGPVDGNGTGDGKDYYGGPNLWNDNGTVSQSMGVCTFGSWYVDATARNVGDGAVLSYPNIHKDWHNWGNDSEPRLDTYARISTRFAHDAPDAGIWNFAYDVWINGVGNGPGTTELMIWTEYRGQRPAGELRGTVTISGTDWKLWTTGDNQIVSYVATTPMTSGELDVSAFTKHLMSTGRLAPNSTLGQIGYGVEIVDTAGQKRRFDVTAFQVDGY